MQANTDRKRIDYLDDLRLGAIACVLVLHTVAIFGWSDLPVTSAQWHILNVYEALARWAVPVFFMISGALFLTRTEPVSIRRMLTRNIPRVAVPWLIWSVVYAVINARKADPQAGWRQVVEEFPVTNPHLWFMPVLIGLYLVMPLLWQLVQRRKLAWYFVALFLLSTVLPRALGALQEDGLIERTINALGLELATGYAGYMVLGFLLATSARQWGLTIPALGFIGASAAAGWLTAIASARAGEPDAVWYGNLSIFTVIASVAIFVFAKELRERYPASPNRRLVPQLGGEIFGVYLIHILVLWAAAEIPAIAGLHTIFVPAIAAGCFIVCWLVVAVIRRIPGVGRWLV